MKKNRKSNSKLYLLLIAVFGMGIAYASVNSVILLIGGDAEAKEQKEIFITDVKCYNPQEYDNALCDEDNIKFADSTKMKSNINLESENSSTITYQITVFNNSDESYYYDEVLYMLGEDTYSNENITFEIRDESNTNLLKDKLEVPSKTELTFNIIFKYKEDADITNSNLMSLLNFKFVKRYTIDYLNIENSSVLPNYIYSDETLNLALSNIDRLEIKESKKVINSERYSFVENNLTFNDILGNLIIYDKEWNFDYTGSHQEFTPPINAKYKLEVWGAQGGTYSEKYYGGYGGYAVGELDLNSTETIFIYVGGTGERYDITKQKLVYGGYNGGGNSSKKSDSTSSKFVLVSGGGATDMRLTSGGWNEETSLYSRIIVAGGGAGSTYYDSTRIGYGGYGGGITGGNGTSTYKDAYKGTGGTQIAAGTGNKAALAGGFGYGGNGDTSGEWTATGGGGGWYGGGAGYAYQAAGGGGSGWIYTNESFNNWSTENPTDAAKWNVDTKYYLKNASLSAGNEIIIEPNGTEREGHIGNGYARITLIEFE